jgi:hypothetical protein
MAAAECACHLQGNQDTRSGAEAAQTVGFVWPHAFAGRWPVLIRIPANGLDYHLRRNGGNVIAIPK